MTRIFGNPRALSAFFTSAFSFFKSLALVTYASTAARADRVRGGSLGGDERSKDLIESYMTDWTKGFAKGGIDRGVASSLFPEKDKFVAQCLATYPQLKKAKDALKFGYKVSYPGLLEKRPEAKEVTELSEDMQDNAFEKMKKNMGF